jgi:hypothetical protein
MMYLSSVYFAFRHHVFHVCRGVRSSDSSGQFCATFRNPDIKNEDESIVSKMAVRRRSVVSGMLVHLR